MTKWAVFFRGEKIDLAFMVEARSLDVAVERARDRLTVRDLRETVETRAIEVDRMTRVS